jgi:hypothetical protein
MRESEEYYKFRTSVGYMLAVLGDNLASNDRRNEAPEPELRLVCGGSGLGAYTN